MDNELLYNLIMISGIGHIGLSLGSLFIPIAMKWRQHLNDLKPLFRQMFWTYAGYILMINISFGLVAFFGTSELLNHSFLAKYMNALISLYWLGRLGIQFFYFDKTDSPKGILFTIGELVLVILFAFFFGVHALALLHNFSWI